MSNDLHICILIPAFNNGGTVGAVVERALATGLPVIVVNDGSTDGTAEILSRLPVTVVSYGKNRGKGHALKTGFRKATGLGYDYAVTIDADGQHFPEDIPALLDHAEKDRLVVGSRNLNAEGMPSGNTFANRFSNFWFTLQTGERVPDTQSGFRIYSLGTLPPLWMVPSRYEAELLLLVLSAWKGVRIDSVPIRICYPEDRVSHFRPHADFARISVLNVILCLLAVVYGYPRLLMRKIVKR